MHKKHYIQYILEKNKHFEITLSSVLKYEIKKTKIDIVCAVVKYSNLG